MALGRLTGMLSSELIAQKELEGRSYSATLVAAVDTLLTENALRLSDIGCIVVVNGPGSFTGVRVGLSAAKGFASAIGIPVVAVSRLEVLARKAGVLSAALDAHRHEVFLRVCDSDLKISGAARREGGTCRDHSLLASCGVRRGCCGAFAGSLAGCGLGARACAHRRRCAECCGS